MGLKNYLFRKEMRRTFRHGRFVSWSSVRSVLILAECATEGEVAGVTAIADSVRKEGIRATVCIYTEAKALDVTRTDTLYVMTKKYVSLFGRPKREAAGTLLDTAFDVTIDLTRQRAWAMRYLLLRVKTRMRCGRSGGEYDLYDFMIDDSAAAPEELFRQTRLYLNMIKEC